MGVVTAIVGPAEMSDMVFLSKQLSKDYHELGAVVTVDNASKGPNTTFFTRLLADFCFNNRITFTVFYAHWDTGERAGKFATLNIVECATRLIAFFQPGDLRVLQIMGEFKKAGKEVITIRVGKRD